MARAGRERFTRILIIGGYGRFGGQLARLLAARPDTTLLIAGRNLAQAAAFGATIRSPARILPMRFDRDGDVLAQITEVAPDLIVDASGPFQIYGADPYRVVKAALECGSCYIDLADGADFVAGIDAFDAAARARGIFILSGLSSYPALTAAAVAELASGMTRVETIRTGIAPSPRAELGRNVVRAIASYAGKPIKIWRDGRAGTAHAMTETWRATIAPPGLLPLRSRRFMLVDAPDLQVLQRRWPELQSVWAGAGIDLGGLNLLLLAAAWLVRLGVLPALTPLAGLMHRCLDFCHWGEHRSGMIVAVAGRDAAGNACERSWHLLAEGDAGPVIPAMAGAALISCCDAGRFPSAGARPAIHDLSLADFQPLFDQLGIPWGCRDTATTGPLYQQLLGAAWDELPAEIRAMHDLGAIGIANGEAIVDRGTGRLARSIARIFGFPAAGQRVPVQVAFRTMVDRDGQGGSETWQRNFAGRLFHSQQAGGRGREAHLLVERFGPFSFGLAILVRGGRLVLVPRRMRFCGLPLPASWAPRGDCHEAAVNGRFNFHVEIGHPLTGLIVRYRGWLVPAVD